MGANFGRFRLAFVWSLAPAAFVLLIALLLPSSSPQPWLATVLAIALWFPLVVTLLMSWGLFSLFRSGDPLTNRALGSWATLLAGSLALLLAARLLPGTNWNLNFILLIALGLLAVGGGLGAARRWVFVAIGIEVVVLLVPAVFPHSAYWASAVARKADAKMARSLARPLAINPAKPPPFWDPATGKP